MMVNEPRTRNVVLEFQHGEPSKGTYEFIAYYGTLTVVPCNSTEPEHAACRTMLEGLRAIMADKPTARWIVDLTTINRLDGSKCCVAHQPISEITAHWQEWTPSFSPESKFDLNGQGQREYLSLGGGAAGSSSCALLIDWSIKEAIMIDCGLSVGVLANSMRPDRLIRTSNPYAIWDDETREEKVPISPLPDLDTLESILKQGVKIIGIFLTHAHMDHYAALPQLIERFYPDFQFPPLYGSAFSVYMAYEHMKQYFQDREGIPLMFFPLEPIMAGKTVKVGPFEIEAFEIFHSVPDAFGYIVRTNDNPECLVISGDFKSRYADPGDRLKMIQRLASIGPVKVLLGDTTNAYLPGWTGLETSVREGLIDIILSSHGRVIVALLASHLERIIDIYQSAREMGRSIAICGTSLQKTMPAAKAAGIQLPELASESPASADIIIVTGSQADIGSVLDVLSEGRTYSGIRLTPDDTVVESSRPIPGRYWAVAQMNRRLLDLKVHLWLDSDFPGPDDMFGANRARTHVSGHGSAEDIRTWLRHLRPTYFAPIHASRNSRIAAARIAAEEGVNPTNIVLPEHSTFSILW